MYSKEERQKAVDLYIKYGKRASATIRELGYPDRKTLAYWYKEYEEQGRLHDAPRRQAWHSFSRDYDDDQVRAAVNHYLTHGRSYSYTMRSLGYPCLNTLKSWIRLLAPDAVKDKVYHRGTCTEEGKNAAVSAYYACPEKSVEEIVKEQGMTRSTVYKHKHKLEGMGYNVPEMDSRRKKKHAKAEEQPPAYEPQTEKEAELMAELAETRKQLKEKDRQLYEMTLRNAILEKLAELKKARAST